MHRHFHVLLSMLSVIVLSASIQAQDQASKQREPHKSSDHAEMAVPKGAVAVLFPTQGNKVKGEIILTQKGDVVHITGKVTNLSPGEHGFHIHEFGDLRSVDGTSAGGHYDPDGHKHGGPDDQERHAGDFGNITANAEGVAMVDKQSKNLKLHFAVGRAIVVHAGADDFKSQPSGAAGDRVAVGVIGFANEEKSQKSSQK